MTTNDLHMPLHSAYKQNHSNESALLKVTNYILLNMEAQKVTLLILLDLCRAPRYCRITPLLYEMHWLPVRQRINFKILLFVFKAIHGIAPTYLRELVSITRPGNFNLRSSSDSLLLAPVCCLLRHFGMYHRVRFVLLQIYGLLSAI